MINNYWSSAFKELKTTKMLILAALFTALRIAISLFYIPVAGNMKIFFTFFVNAFGSMIYGPILALISGFVNDIIGFAIAPSGPFFPGYTLTAMLSSFVYALYFYRQRITVVRIVLCKLTVNLLINVMLGSLWSYMMFGKAFYYYFTKSIVKNMTLLPLEVILLFMFFQVMLPITARMNLIKKPESNTIPFI